MCSLFGPPPSFPFLQSGASMHHSHSRLCHRMLTSSLSSHFSWSCIYPSSSLLKRAFTCSSQQVHTTAELGLEHGSNTQSDHARYTCPLLLQRGCGTSVGRSRCHGAAPCRGIAGSRGSRSGSRSGSCNAGCGCESRTSSRGGTSWQSKGDTCRATILLREC